MNCNNTTKGITRPKSALTNKPPKMRKKLKMMKKKSMKKMKKNPKIKNVKNNLMEKPP